MFHGCGCNNGMGGLGYKPVVNGESIVGDKTEDATVINQDNLIVVATVCDLHKGQINTFKKLLEILRANMRGEHPYQLNTLQVNDAANFIRQADLFGACEWMLNKEGYNFDPVPYVDEIVANGVPGEFSFAGLADNLPLFAAAGIALFALTSTKKSAPARAWSK